jgi:hypothetical protein
VARVFVRAGRLRDAVEAHTLVDDDLVHLNFSLLRGAERAGKPRPVSADSRGKRSARPVIGMTGRSPPDNPAWSSAARWLATSIDGWISRGRTARPLTDSAISTISRCSSCLASS